MTKPRRPTVKKAAKTPRKRTRAAPKAAPPAPVVGPRGGKTATRPDRQVSMTFKMSLAQYQILTQARVAANVTTQDFVLRALGHYFEHELEIKFLEEVT